MKASLSTFPKHKLGELCEINIGKTPSRSKPSYWGGENPWLSIADMNQGRSLWRTKESITNEGIRASGIKPVPKNTLLLSYKLSIGKVGITERDMFTNEAIAALPVIDPSILSVDYLYWTLSTIDLLETSDRAAMGATLNKAKLKELQIPLPPLDEQKRIAAILDAADALRAKRRQSIAQLDALIQSTFLDLFGDALDSAPVDIASDRKTLPKGCTWTLLTDVARLATGHTPDRERSDYWNGEIPWISLTDIRNLDGKIAKATLQSVTPLGIDNSSSVLLPKNTVCFSRTASVGFVTVMGREMCTSQDFMNWVCGEKIEPIYLMWALIISRKRLLALSTGSTHRTIYMRVIERFRVLLPAIEKQRRFAAIVESIEHQKTTQRTHLAELDTLFAALQHRAFRGEL
jgi:type I restriction enzyme S subunit